VNTQTDPNNCGTCGNFCGLFEYNDLPNLCAMGACCPAPPSGVLRPQYVCNGVCTDPDSDDNCGGCGNVCPAAYPSCDWNPTPACCVPPIDDSCTAIP
jgi:hypothetical protein